MFIPNTIEEMNKHKRRKVSVVIKKDKEKERIEAKKREEFSCLPKNTYPREGQHNSFLLGEWGVRGSLT